MLELQLRTLKTVLHAMAGRFKVLQRTASWGATIKLYAVRGSGSLVQTALALVYARFAKPERIKLLKSIDRRAAASSQSVLLESDTSMVGLLRVVDVNHAARTDIK